MAIYRGDAANVGLAGAWQPVLEAQYPQRIIHGLSPSYDCGRLFDGQPAYEAWRKGGPGAIAESIRLMAQSVGYQPYIRNARLAVRPGASNTRIYIVPRKEWNLPGYWRRFACEVEAPYLAAATGETIYQVWLEDCRTARIRARRVDVNRWGPVVMLTGYSADGQVEWREFLSETDQPQRWQNALGYLERLVLFAQTHGVLLQAANAG